MEGWQRVGEMRGGIGCAVSGETPGEVVDPGGSLDQDETFGASRASLTTSRTAPSLLRAFWFGNLSRWWVVFYNYRRADPNGPSTRPRDEPVVREQVLPSMSNPLNPKGAY